MQSFEKLLYLAYCQTKLIPVSLYILIQITLSMLSILSVDIASDTKQANLVNMIGFLSDSILDLSFVFFPPFLE